MIRIYYSTILALDSQIEPLRMKSNIIQNVSDNSITKLYIKYLPENFLEQWTFYLRPR